MISTHILDTHLGKPATDVVVFDFLLKTVACLGESKNQCRRPRQ